MASRLSAEIRPLLRNAAFREASCSRCQAASSSQQLLSFSTSARAQESRRKRIARVKRQANLEQRQLKETLLERSKPDPILGHQLNDEGKALWDVSELRQVILAKEDVWSGKVAEAIVGETVGEETKPGPAQLNFGLSEEDRKLLFQDLPDIMVEDRLLDSPEASASNPNDLRAISKDMEAHSAEEQQNVGTLSRILDLRNASGKGIQVENTRRVIDAFGGGKDTGSSEVQAAVLTFRIRNLYEHLQAARHDNSNRRAMNILVHQRAKILKYLKRKSPQRYAAVLPRLGLDPRAVEGELVLPGKPKIARR